MRDYGFNQVQNYDKLIKIFEILDDKIEIIDYTLILPNNYKELIGDLQCTLSKDFYKYKSKLYYKAMTKKEWDKYQEERRQLRIKEEKKKILEVKKQEELKEKIKKLCIGKNYRNKEWIEKNIGEYYTWDIAIEYFWTIIGDEYYQAWNGDIILTENKINEIRNIKEDIVDLKGTTFLSRKFKYKGKYSHGIDITKKFKKEKKKPVSYGVYGIYKDNNLIYIGSTMRDFQERFGEHIQNIISKSKELYVYSLLNDEDNISFKILIDIAQLKTNSNITRRDVESMELGLITIYKPPGNLAGNKYEFKYRES